MTNTKKYTGVQKMAVIAILLALEIVMAFTPIGYLKVGTLSISFLCIPVAIGAIVIGPSAGLILGTVFGLTSFFQCFGMDAFGTAMFSINPFYTFIICVVSRALMGWLTGIIDTALFKIFGDQQAGKYYIHDIVSIILCPCMNTLFFLGFMALFFHGITVMGLNVITMVVIPALSVNCIIEIIACAVIGSALSIALKKILK